MGRAPLTFSLTAVRRLTVTKQRLAGRLPPRATKATICSVVRDLAYVQWDPVSVVAPSHLLSFWARLGAFRPSDLETLLWEERKLLLHWTPMATIVLADDYPLYHSLNRRYPESLTRSWGNHRVRAKAFLDGHSALRKKVLNELRGGPLTLGQFEDHARTSRDDGEFNPGSDVSLMLYHLLMSGEVMVVGHRGSQNLWGLSEQFLPRGVEKGDLTAEEFERAAAQRAIRALGTATPTEITYYFVRGRYDRLRATLAALEKESTIHRVVVEGLGGRDERYIHDQDVPLIESMEGRAWQPRVSLLPPFDNLICSTARTKRMFGFDYVREQFLPKEKRRFGTYVLPILWGDRFIGRIDPRFDKQSKELVINAVHVEPGAPTDRELGAGVREVIERLATFLGAQRVRYSPRVPAAWSGTLR